MPLTATRFHDAGAPASAGLRELHRRPRLVAGWLLGVAALVFAMVVIGGITRLTESGLSIVRWEPLSGIVPPLTEQGWRAEFEAYKAFPEYQKINRGMSLAEFKAIYFWEYLHRLMGRLIGAAFALPLAWFAIRRMIPPGLGPRLVLIFILGGLQGAVGWWMVASGLIDRPDVAHERLAVHLMLALAIFAALVWTALDLLEKPARPSRGAAAGVAAGVANGGAWTLVLLGLLAAQVMFGAFTAGLNAGHAFNSWPKMGGDWIPPTLDGLRPLWRNAFDNPIAVQFIHRWLAVVVAGATLAFAHRLWRAGGGGRARGAALAGAVLLQFLLGVLTLVHGVPIPLGVAHQAGAVVLLAALLVAGHWAVQRRGSHGR